MTPKDELSVAVDAFVNHLYALARADDPEGEPDLGALARLRRGLGKPPGAAAEMMPEVVPYLREQSLRDEYAAERRAFFLVGALFGFHPKAPPRGSPRANLG